MGGAVGITGRIVKAARSLAGVSKADFATACGLTPEDLGSLEAAGSAWLGPDAAVEAIRRGLDYFGVVVVEEGDGMGAGVRLKFTRQDVAQITRLESEGGMVGADDAP